MPEWTPHGPHGRPDPNAYPGGQFGWVPPPAGPPPPPPAPTRSRALPYVVIVGLVALVVGYGFAVYATRDSWQAAAPRDGVRVTFTAAGLDGTPPSPAALAQTRDTVQSRVDDLGGSPAPVLVDGERIVVTVAGTDDARTREIVQAGQMFIRPVIHAIPAAGGPSAGIPPKALPGTPPRPPGDSTQRIADEKALRQSTDQQIQVLALQFQATRCGDADALTDNDDPTLPLVTCSQDHQEVYLLAPSIINARQIQSATAAFDEQRNEHVIDVQFDREATTTWADFTAANAGTQTAFTMDTHVISAPMISEAIPGGRTQISGQFDADSARDLAISLRHGALASALTFDSSSDTTIPGEPASTPLRVGLIAGGVVLTLLMALGIYYLLARRRRVAPVGP